MGGRLALRAAARPGASNSIAAIDVCCVPLRYAAPMQAALDGRRLAEGATHFPALGDDHARQAFFGAEGDFTAEALAYDATLRTPVPGAELPDAASAPRDLDRKSTRLNSSH